MITTPITTNIIKLGKIKKILKEYRYELTFDVSLWEMSEEKWYNVFCVTTGANYKHPCIYMRRETSTLTLIQIHTNVDGNIIDFHTKKPNYFFNDPITIVISQRKSNSDYLFEASINRGNNQSSVIKTAREFTDLIHRTGTGEAVWSVISLIKMKGQFLVCKS